MLWDGLSGSFVQWQDGYLPLDYSARLRLWFFSIYSQHLMSQRKRLVATWRRAVRAVAGSGHQEDVTPLLKELMINPIDRLYYYGPGTRFGASRPFDHARSIAFCTFLRHFLGPAWLWTTVFFQLAWKTGSMFDDVLVQRWHRKKSRLERLKFHPCWSRQSLAIAPGQSSWPKLRKGAIQEEQIYLTLEKKCYFG